MDDLMFTAPAAAIANNNAPYLFRIGPVYGQLFNTGVDQNRFVYAEDTDYIWLPVIALFSGKPRMMMSFYSSCLLFLQDAA
jgi:hypothetical protein